MGICFEVCWWIAIVLIFGSKYAASTEDKKCFQLQDDKTTLLHGDCIGAEDLVVTSQLLNVTFMYSNPVNKQITLTFNFGGCVLLVDYSTVGNNAVFGVPGQPNYLPLNFEISPSTVLVTKQGSASFEVEHSTPPVFTPNAHNTYRINVKYETKDAADLSGLTAVFKATIFVPNEKKGVFANVWTWVAMAVGVLMVAVAIVVVVICFCYKKSKEEKKDNKEVKAADGKSKAHKKESEVHEEESKDRKKESKASKRIPNKAVQVNSAVNTSQLATPVSSHTGVSFVMPQDSMIVPKKETEKTPVVEKPVVAEKSKEPSIQNAAPAMMKSDEKTSNDVVVLDTFENDSDIIFEQPSKSTSTKNTTK